jgi:hypothetical protein
VVRYPSCSVPKHDARMAALQAYMEATLRQRLVELGYPGEEVLAAVQRGRHLAEVCAEFRLTGRISR